MGIRKTVHENIRYQECKYCDPFFIFPAFPPFRVYKDKLLMLKRNRQRDTQKTILPNQIVSRMQNEVEREMNWLRCQKDSKSVAGREKSI